jgi:hypothetical protein
LRGALVFPESDVVALAPVGGAVAAGEAAVPVPDHEGVEQGRRDRSGGGAVVEDAGPPGGQHPVQRRVAKQSVDRGPVKSAAIDCGCAGGGGREVTLDVENQIQMGTMAATAAGLLVVQEMAAVSPRASARRVAGLRAG